MIVTLVVLLLLSGDGLGVCSPIFYCPQPDTIIVVFVDDGKDNPTTRATLNLVVLLISPKPVIHLKARREEI